MKKRNKNTVYLSAHPTDASKCYNTTTEKIVREKYDEVENDEIVDTTPLDKNLKLMSPTRMVMRRFFRSKLSVIGLVMVIGLFLFSFVGPYIYHWIVPAEGVLGNDQVAGWQQSDKDKSGKWVLVESEYEYTAENGQKYTIKQTLHKHQEDNTEAGISKLHPLGTDFDGYDNLTKLMYGGRVSLIVSFLAVFLITVFGVVLGGIAGYFGGVIDNIIMRVCDVLTCLPGIPIMLIVGASLNALASPDPVTKMSVIEHSDKIYILMIFLSCISWPGTARLVRGQILSLREQEYMVAAEAMGYSTFRKIFKHLIPNVMPQLIVQMTLGLGSMIIYESSLSYLGFGVQPPETAWGTIVNVFSNNSFDKILANPLVWVPAGLCIIIAVLGFNFVGDGLRDALDPKSRR